MLNDEMYKHWVKEYKGIPAEIVCDGPIESAKLFIEAGADIDVVGQGRHDDPANDGPRTETPLALSAHYFNVELVKYLIAQGADVNYFDKSGRTALSFVLGVGHGLICQSDAAKVFNVTEALVEAGASVNVFRWNYMTVLHGAARMTGNNKRVVRLLLDHGAKIFIDGDWNTPLDLVDKNGRDSREIGEWLLEAQRTALGLGPDVGDDWVKAGKLQLLYAWRN